LLTAPLLALFGNTRTIANQERESSGA
jgi:hypothetical protein